MLFMFLACPGTTSFLAICGAAFHLLVPKKNKIVIVFVWVGLDSNKVRLMKSSASEPLFSAEAPAGYPNKNSNNRKIESARGRMGCLFPFLQPIQSVRYKEASAETRENELFLRMKECSIFRMYSNAKLIKMDCRSVTSRDRFVILARKVYICNRFFA